MSSYSSYVPWRSKEASSSEKGDANGKSSSDPVSPTLERNGRSSYAGLSSYRPPQSTSGLRGAMPSTVVRDRSGSGEPRPALGKYARAYNEKADASPKAQEPPKEKTLYRRYSSSYTPPETPTLRLGSSARFGGQIARSPLSDKSPTVFGVSGPPTEDDFRKEEKLVLVSRGTSPTPPPNSSFLRARRADKEAVTTTEIPKPYFRPHCVSKEVQTDDKEPTPSATTRVISPSVGSSLGSTRSISWSGGRTYTPTPSPSPPPSRYTPRVGGYSYTRPTDLPLPRISTSTTESEAKDDAKTKPKLESPSYRVGGFSYSKPNEPPVKLGLPKVEPIQAPAVESGKDKADEKPVSKPPPKPNDADSKEPGVKKSESKTKVKKSKSSGKMLPPQVPKSDPPKSLLGNINKDFRKSTLNMDLSTSTESIDKKLQPSSSKTKVNGTKTVKKSSSKLKVSPSLPKLTLNASSAQKSNVVINRVSDSDSSSEETSSTESEESSSEESSGVGSSKGGTQQTTKKGSLLAVSKTSGQLSSTDEGNMTAEKPPKPPLSPRSMTKHDIHKNEDAKTVVVRAVAPVNSGLMKVKYPSSTATSSSAEDLSDKTSQPRSTADKSKGSTSDGSDEQSYRHYVLRKFDSTDKAWWMESNKDIPGLSKNSSNKSVNAQTVQKDPSIKSIPEVEPKVDEEKPENFQQSNHTPGFNKIHTKLYKIRKMDSGERAWWMESTTDVTGLSKSESDASESESKTSGKSLTVPGLQKNESSKSLPPIQKNESSKSLPPIQKNESSKSLPPIQKNESSKSIPGLQKNESSKSLPPVQKNESSKSVPGLQKNESSKSVPGIQKNESSKSVPGIQKNESSKSVPGLQKNESSKAVPGLQKNESSKSDPGTKKADIGKPVSGLRKAESLKCIPVGVQRNESSKSLTGLHKNLSCKSIPGLQKNDSCKSVPGLQRNLSLKSIPGLRRTASSRSLLEKSKESSSLDLESDSKSGKEGDTSSSEFSTKDFRKPLRLCRIESGDREWWLEEEEKSMRKRSRSRDGQVFVSAFVNIDHVLGTIAPPPAALLAASEDSDSGGEDCQKIAPDQVIIHDSTAKNSVISKTGMIKLDDTALQLYKDGDYGAYLDLDASIDEQQEEFDTFSTNRKNSIVLRTQLSVRVHTIIEKLLNSEGRELRRALFSLKQIFQEDKDLVHEFVQNDGLACLIKVGTDADQNYQNYILRALGQIMLYVDGMNGVIDHPATVQWLYNLVASKFRLVVKTALKLLLVFVEYVETNCVLFVKALRAVDYVHCTRPWSNIMKLMKEYDAADTELLIYAMSLVNKTLNGLPDQDMYYDQVDALEEQGLEAVIRRYMSKQGTDLDLLRQFQIYEAVLQHEDGEEKGTPLRQLDETIRKAIRNRKCLTATLNPVEKRRSRRILAGNAPLTITLTPTRHITPDVLSPTENIMNGDGVGVTPGLRRRRERAERQRSFIREQREATLRAQLSSSDQSTTSDDGLSNGNGPVTTNGHSMHNGVENHVDQNQSSVREGTVKDLTQKLATTLHSPGEEPKLTGGPFGDMKGIISKAKEGLAKSQSRADMLRSPSGEVVAPRPPEVKKTETEVHWDELVATSTRDLCLCDLDFRDLASDDERDILAPTNNFNGVPPPPPPAPLPALDRPPPPLNSVQNTPPAKKTKKTVKLFWKEVREDPIVINKMNAGNLLWDELSPVVIDTQKLEHLFESRAKDLITKKQQEMNKNKEIIVLDPKRSNAINIGMTKLPPPRSIKTAILKMDATVMNREGIEKLLTMLPTEEERSKIQEAQAANPDLPLGSAEQFLLTLASISELDARLKLWAFKLDYENSEKEIAEPLMDLKQGMETLRVNRTFKAILGTLLSIGIFLNGTEVKGFQIEYLSKVPEVKDTVHKHSLLHHLCYMVMEKFPDSTDLYSEIGAVTRASKVDFEELAGNIHKMEQECKASFDHLKLISKHDGTNSMKLKMSDFLADCAERIIVLSKVHRRIINRFHKFSLWLGIPLHRVSSVKPNELCRVVSEFALEYRTTRERVLQQLQKKASHRERNKTRGKMITEVGKFRSQEDRADAELKQLLGNEPIDKSPNHTLHGSLPWRRTRKEAVISPVDGTNGSYADADDELLETLVKTATKTPVSRTTPRERKRTRNADRKSLIKRSRTRENVPCGNISESA